MTFELTALALAALLQAAQLVLMAVPANLELGPGKTLSPRDPHRLKAPLAEQVSPRTGRLYRAYDNHNEALLLFAIACVLVTLAGAASPLTAGLAAAYLVARALYVPAYAFGWVPWRSLFFAVAWFASLAMILIALFASSG
ncbi:Inner membrane protein [Oceanicola granulosus HTCC2516]|uniref:Inner membrane protein n=1 Tax=Oceanicola granulosus (strain ATCC BAA-861 / DSM 15982 / KCTC 12143 / HTCC2516) TaxID=314256 RepID=Q2CI22_OCEGH|nr:MAPEG family protein [Oceanicola granulosus]EAR52436.1 Inner membrane protein [Oceanicola granulosus HTCC2516]